MFSNITSVPCVIPDKFVRIYNREYDNFIKIVSAEDRLANSVRNKEIQLTAENPQIREQEETTKICTELSLRLRQQIVDKKRCQQLRENDLNLRDLQKQIRTARVAKELNDQRIAYKGTLEEQKCQKQKEIEERKRNQTLVVEVMRQQELLAMDKKKDFRNGLKVQMKENQQKIAQQKLNIIEDQKVIYELEAATKANELNEWQQIKDRKKHQQEEIQKSLKVNEEIVNKEKDARVKELQLLLKIQKECEEKVQRAKEEKALKGTRVQELTAKIGRHLIQLQTEKKIRENELLDLLVEELKAIEDKKHKQSVNAMMQERKQLQAEYELNQDLQLYKKNQTKEKNEIVHLQQKENALKAKEHEILVQKKRKEKTQAYGKEITEIIAANREQRIADAIIKKQLDEKHLNDEQKRLEEVKMEHKRLYDAEPAEVLKFLPLRHRKNCCI